MFTFKHIYELDEFQIIPRTSAYAYGHAVLNCEYQHSDDNYWFEIVSIVIDGHESKDAEQTLPKDHPLFKLISDRMHDDAFEYVQNSIRRSKDIEYDNYRADRYDRMKDDRLMGGL